MQEFSPGVRVGAEPVPMTDLVRLVFSYKGEGAAHGDPLRPTNVGFGLTHALPVIVACLAAEPGTMLVVENPEAQLHPRGQVSIGRLLALTAASGVQVIIESHSDHVLNGIRLAVKDGLLASKAREAPLFLPGPRSSKRLSNARAHGGRPPVLLASGIFRPMGKELGQVAGLIRDAATTLLNGLSTPKDAVHREQAIEYLIGLVRTARKAKAIDDQAILNCDEP